MGEKRGDTNIDATKGLEKLLGESQASIPRALAPEENVRALVGKILGKYKIDSFMEATNKKWIYSGRHPELLIDICIKVLRPDVDEKTLEAFLKEKDNLTKLNHPNAERIFDAGEQEGYHYIITERVKGKNLKARLDAGERFSSEVTIEIIADTVLGVLDYARRKGCPHTDVKLENIVIEDNDRPLSERIRVIDFGPWYSDHELRNHVSGTAHVLEYLLKNRADPNTKIPDRLNEIIEEAKEKAKRGRGYKNPGEFKDAIESYRKGIITRRKFSKVIGGGIALAGLGYGSFEYLGYRNSIGYIVKQIEDTEADDHKKMNSLVIEFTRRAAYQKVLPLYEDEEVAKRAANQKIIPSYEGERVNLGGYFFATDSEGDWHFPDTIKSTSGRLVRIFGNLHNITGDVRFAELEEQAASHIKFNKGKERGLEPIRCLHADKDILKAVTYFDGDDGFYNPEIGFYDIGAAFYSRFGNQVAENERIISAHSLEMILPLILEASNQMEDRHLAAQYREHVIRHTDAIEKYLIRQDDTIRDLAKFNIETGEIIEGNYLAHSPEASTSLHQTIAIDWFATMFEQTGNEEYQKTAHRLLQPYISTLPSDYIPYFVIPRRTNMPKDMPKDTAAALRMGLTLQNHPWLLPQQQRDSLFYGTLRSVIVNHADTNPNTDAIITGMCYNYRTRDYTNSCTVVGLDSFVEIVRGIKEKD